MYKTMKPLDCFMTPSKASFFIATQPKTPAEIIIGITETYPTAISS